MAYYYKFMLIYFIIHLSDENAFIIISGNIVDLPGCYSNAMMVSAFSYMLVLL
jgi:hypothetical protein